jgi:hypothetical protein
LSDAHISGATLQGASDSDLDVMFKAAGIPILQSVLLVSVVKKLRKKRFI